MVPDVSVIIVNYNGRKHLADCLNSVFELDYPSERLDVVMVDNNSSDGSSQYVTQHYPTVRLIPMHQNVGFARGNNIAAQQARGEYLALLNNDMKVDRQWLSELVKGIQSEDDVACVGSKIMTWEGEAIDFAGGMINFYGMGFQPNDEDITDDTLRNMLFACGGAMLIKRNVFIDSGGFDDSYFAYFEDVDLGWRLWLFGYRVLLAPRALTYHRGHATGKTFASERRSLLYERNALYTIIKNYSDEVLNRVLPVALLLTARRSVMMTRANKDEFRMETQLPSNTLSSMTKKAGQPAERHYRRELRTLLREHGVIATGKELIRLIVRWLYTHSVVQIKRDVAFVPKVSLSPLLALDDLAETLPQVWAKREAIQQRRVRGDEEILPLFQGPFHPHPPDPVYLELQQQLACLFQVDQVFQQPDKQGRDNVNL